MSAPPFHARGAVAFQLAAVLETYRAEVALLVSRGFDPEAYRRVGGYVEQMRMYAAVLPGLSVAWVELMIRHFELTHGLWRLQQQDGAPAELQRLHAQLGQAVERLSRKCVQLMPAA